jgi:hypothetical protein
MSTQKNRNHPLSNLEKQADFFHYLLTSAPTLILLGLRKMLVAAVTFGYYRAIVVFPSTLGSDLGPLLGIKP